MFEYSILTSLDERFDYGEDRWISIGMLGPGYAVVVWTEHDDDIIRIILSLHEEQIKMSAEDMKHTSRTNWERFEAADILRWFRQHHPDYTTQINDIPRQYIPSQEHATSGNATALPDSLPLMKAAVQH
jgi:uncharacterized DUF497 family protein